MRIDFTKRQTQDVRVTPALARAWLQECNVRNRSIKKRKLAAYAADMRAGRWRPSPVPVIFSAEGVLIDGQHRLMAVAESGATVTLAVATGWDVDLQDDMDTGVARSMADVLTLRGHANTSTVAAIARRIVLYESGDGWENPALAQKVPTHSEMLAVVEKYPELAGIATQVMRQTKCSGLPASIAGFCWWLFLQTCQDAASDVPFFFERLCTGEALIAGDPVYELRKRTLESQRQRRDRTYYRDTYMLTALTCKAWNAYRDGEKIQVLSFKPGGARPEAFPYPH